MPGDSFSATVPDALVVASRAIGAVRGAGGLARARVAVAGALRELVGWPVAIVHTGHPFPSPDDEVEPGEALDDTAPVVRAVLRAARSRWWSDSSADGPPPVAALDGTPVATVVAVPVVADRGMVAVIVVADAVARPVDRCLMDRLEAMAVQLAVAEDASSSSRLIADEAGRRTGIERVTATGTWELDLRDGQLTYSSELIRLTGHDEPPADVLSVVDLLHPDDRAQALRLVEQVRAGIVAGGHRFRVRRNDGSYGWVEFEVTRLVGDRAWGTGRDVDAQVAAEEREEVRRSWFELAEELAHVAAWELDVAAGTCVWSPEYYRIVGRDPATFAPTLENIATIIHPDDVGLMAPQIDAQVHGEVIPTQRLRFVRPDGSVRWVEARSKFIGPSRLLGFVQDVTDRHVAEQQRRMHTHILDHLDHSLVVVDMAGPGRVLYANRRAAEQYGKTVDQLLASGVEELRRQSSPALRRAVAEVLRTAQPWSGDLETTIAGEPCVVHLTASILPLPEGGDALVMIAKDVTELRRNEAALRSSEQRAQVLIDHAPIGMAVADPDGRILQVNDAMRSMFRLGDAALSEFELAPRVHPDDLAAQVDALDSVRSGECESTQVECRVRRGDGSWMWAITSMAAVRGAGGDAQLLMGQVVDITDRRAAEERLRQVADELRTASQAKTQFLSRMSHELRTPLNAVLGYSQLLALDPLGPDQQEAVGHVLHAGRHLLELIDEVLDLSRLDAGAVRLDLQDLDVRAVISEALRLVRPMADEHRVGVTVELETAQTPQAVRADRRRLTQVLVNLLTNGIKYNRPGGRVAVGARLEGAVVQLSVSDTGRGIAPSEIDRVFEPFDRLDAEQRGIDGSGIGMPLARSLAEHMGGRLSVESEAGAGSTFTLELPAGEVIDERPPERARRANAELVIDLEARRRLVVVSIEDNEVNERLMEAIVRLRPDVSLHHAGNVARGLELVGAVRPDLVLVDLHLPDGSGHEVIRALRREGSTPMIAVVSADANHAQVRTALALGADRYLTKPVDVTEVLTVLDEAARASRSTEQAIEGDRAQAPIA